MSALRVRWIEEEADLEPLVGAWDDLAERAGAPTCSPHWMLAWWHHRAPEQARLRVLVVQDGNVLAGIAPWCVVAGPREDRDWRLLGTGASLRQHPLSLPGREREVAGAIAEALAAAADRPTRISLEAVTAHDPWSRLLADGWPGLRPVTMTHWRAAAPVATLGAPDLDTWMQGRSANFRSQMRRRRKRLAKAGVELRLSQPDELERDLDAMLVLHHRRWAARGGSLLSADGTREMLLEVAHGLAPAGRFRLFKLVEGDEIISAQMFLAAGGELSYANGGFDEARGDLAPAVMTILGAIEDALARGESRLDLGGGAQPYKLRFADGDDPLAWRTLIVPGARAPLTAAELAPRALRGRAVLAFRELPAERQEQVKQRLARLRRAGRRAGSADRLER